MGIPIGKKSLANVRNIKKSWDWFNFRILAIGMEQIKKLNREPIGEKNCIGGNSHGMAREPIGDDLEFPREFSNPKYQLSSSKKF